MGEKKKKDKDKKELSKIHKGPDILDSQQRLMFKCVLLDWIKKKDPSMISERAFVVIQLSF